MDKAEAEKIYGFSLYQGGVVPGNSLRVVNIEGVDTEACCGTHCDSTAEVGWIKIIILLLAQAEYSISAHLNKIICFLLIDLLSFI